MTTARFAISADPIGYSAIEVNGRETTDEVQGFRLESVLGQPTVLTLYASAAGAVEGEGIVQVQSADDPAAIVAFLDKVDPDTWEKAAIAKSDWGNGDLKVLMLDVLKSWARGEAC